MNANELEAMRRRLRQRRGDDDNPLLLGLAGISMVALFLILNFI
jgi:hypothetical protein